MRVQLIENLRNLIDTRLEKAPNIPLSLFLAGLREDSPQRIAPGMGVPEFSAFTENVSHKPEICSTECYHL